jgi:hypothetical protein
MEILNNPILTAAYFLSQKYPYRSDEENYFEAEKQVKKQEEIRVREPLQEVNIISENKPEIAPEGWIRSDEYAASQGLLTTGWYLLGSAKLYHRGYNTLSKAISNFHLFPNAVGIQRDTPDSKYHIRIGKKQHGTYPRGPHEKHEITTNVWMLRGTGSIRCGSFCWLKKPEEIEEVIEEIKAEIKEIEVIEITHNGKIYYWFEETKDIYDPETGDIIGTRDTDGVVVFN